MYDDHKIQKLGVIVVEEGGSGVIRTLVFSVKAKISNATCIQHTQPVPLLLSPPRRLGWFAVWSIFQLSARSFSAVKSKVRGPCR